MKNLYRRKHTMMMGLVLFVFVILLASGIIAGIMLRILFSLNLLPTLSSRPFMMIIVLVIPSVVIGTAMAAVIGKWQLRPFRELTNATQEIAAGNFDVRIKLKGPIEVEKLGESFNTMAKELGSIETLRSDFVSNVSHEFKTPIVSIKGFAKLLKKDTLSEESRKEYLDIIIKESERLSQLAGNVLLLSKLENQSFAEELEDFSLDEQIRRAILVLEPVWKKKPIVFNVELEPVIYNASEELLQQVWINLFSNAVKFSNPGGEVAVALYKEDETITVKVSDTGIGMDAETAKHLFDKFYQGDQSHATEGNGLGLSLVKRIVDICGGSVQVESELGKGSTFFVTLPGQRRP